MDLLPVELLTQIAGNLHAEEVVRFALLTCKRFKYLLTSKRGVRKLVTRQNSNLKRIHERTRIYSPFPLSLFSFQALEYLELTSTFELNFAVVPTSIWPESLTTFKCSFCNVFNRVVSRNHQEILEILPVKLLLPNLTCLELGKGHYKWNEFSPTFSNWMTTLPSSLTRLRFYGHSSMYQWLPSSVTDLEVVGAPECLESIPTASALAIRSLDWDAQDQNISSDTLIPFSNLEKITIRSHFDCTPFVFKSTCHLIEINLKYCKITPASLRAMPPTLKHLKVDWNVDESVENYTCFPVTLTTLYWKQKSNPPSTFEQLPPELTVLSLYWEKMQSHQHCHHLDLGHLPKSLTHLNLAKGKFSYLPSQFDALKEYKGLKLLWIDASSFSRHDTAHLPRNITDLALYHVSNNFEDDWLEGLPPKLINLRIIFSQVGAIVTDHLVQYLPKTLAQLTIPVDFEFTGCLVPETCTKLDDFSIVDFFARAMPPHLKIRIRSHLSSLLGPNGVLNSERVAEEGLLFGSNPLLSLGELPRSVSSLHFSYCAVDVNTLRAKFLKHVRFSKITLAENSLNSQNLLFPRHTKMKHLESLCLLAERTLQSHQLRCLIPSGLVSLELPNMDVVYGKDVTPFPPTLKKLTLFGIDQKSIKALLAHSKVIYLTITGGSKLHSVHFASLPSTLTKLCLGAQNNKKQVLRHLAPTWDPKNPGSAPNFPRSSVLTLPRSLTYLDMKTTFGISSAELALLPASLKTLKVICVRISLADLNLESCETLSIPHMLTKLVKGIIPESLSIDTLEMMAEISDHDAAQLPDSLTCLIISNNYKHIGDTFLATLPSSITRLEITCRNQFSYNCLHLLPSSLTHLVLGADRMKSSALASLPRTLRYLELVGALGSFAKASLLHLSRLETCILRTPSGITDGFFSQLPQSLTALTLGQTESLTPAFVELIPPTILCLELHGIKVDLGDIRLPKPVIIVQAQDVQCKFYPI